MNIFSYTKIITHVNYSDIKRTAGVNWYQISLNRKAWNYLCKAYIQRIETAREEDYIFST